MSELRIGTSGWNYPSGRGTWNAVFYPDRRARPKGFEELSFYAEHFDTVEVNSTFYGPPRREICRTWAARTPAAFEFSIKLYQKFTHPRLFRTRLVDRVPDDPGRDDAFIEALVRPNQADLDEFRRGIDPLAETGKLGALLAQFPPSFKDAPSSRAYLADLLRAFGGYRVAVELRHRSWSDNVSSTLALLDAFGAAWTQIDEPKFRVSIRQNFLPNVEGFYYMRLHGRNAAQWWRHGASEDRYDYFYSRDELKPLAETADAARRLVKKLYLYLNNHFAAKAVANAAMLKHQLGVPLSGEYPAAFLDRYPELAGIASTASPRHGR